jgi:heme/copper-type cytochrome/quinol oxidase subunit 2
MGDMWLVFWWTGPIGVGIFLLCLGTMIYLLTKADALNKQTKAGIREHREHLV